MLTDPQIKSLQELFAPEQILTGLAGRLTYEQDAGEVPGMPDGVVLLRSLQDTQKLVRWAKTNQVMIIGRGAGTGLTGGAVAMNGGVIAGFAGMRKVLDVDEESRLAVVQPGVVNQELQKRLEPLGLIFPPDPASYAVSTIGGNIAENAGGPHCLKYGVTNNYVLGLEALESFINMKIPVTWADEGFFECDASEGIHFHLDFKKNDKHSKSLQRKNRRQSALKRDDNKDETRKKRIFREKKTQLKIESGTPEKERLGYYSKKYGDKFESVKADNSN